MPMRQRRRVRKRFYVIMAFLAIFLCILLVKIPQGSSVNTLDIPVMKQEDVVPDPEPDPDSGKKLVICLDPGHGGHDVGAESILGYFEKDINLKVGILAGRLLEKSDYEVIYTRTTDEAKGQNQEEDLKARCNIANEAYADIYVSIHCNFDENSSKSKGVEVWCRFPKQKVEELAICLDKQLAKVGYTRDRGIKYESEGGLFVLQNTKAVAAVVELGFLSNAEDSAFLKSDEGQAKCAEAIAKAIEDYISKGFHQEE